MPTYTKVLKPGTTGTAVVGIDFTEGRQVASFPELARSLPAELAVLECQPAIVEDLADDRLRPDEYARRVVQDVTTAGHRVRAVLARCGGAGLACRVAKEIAVNTGATPTVVLFDPDVVDADHVHMQFERAVHAIRQGIPPELVAAALSRGDDLARRHRGDLGDLLTELHRLYAPLVPSALAHWKIPVELGAELIERFTVFSRYLLCASRVPVPLAHVPIHQVLSRGRSPVPTGQEHLVTRLDVDWAELLAAPETAQVATDLVRNSQVPASPW